MEKSIVCPLNRAVASGILLLAAGQSAAGAITGVYLPPGPASPSNPAWNQTAYRDIPWWFTDENPVWGASTPGAADAYDISAVWAARLNRNNASGYEGAIINTPSFGHLGTNPYGSAGGAISPSLDAISWGNGTIWNFTFAYTWNDGAPIAAMSFQNGATVHATTVNLGSRVIDFVEGDLARPLTAGGQMNPYREPHQLNDMLMRFATVGAYGTDPAYTMDSVTVGNMSVTVDGGAPQPINYNDGSGALLTTLETRWEHVPDGSATSNPREIQFLVFNDILPDHRSSLLLSGQIHFAWAGAVSGISTSGVIFEAKLGDLDFFPPALVAAVPEPCAALLGTMGLGLFMRRRR